MLKDFSSINSESVMEEQLILCNLPRSFIQKLCQLLVDSGHYNSMLKLRFTCRIMDSVVKSSHIMISTELKFKHSDYRTPLEKLNFKVDFISCETNWIIECLKVSLGSMHRDYSQRRHAVWDIWEHARQARYRKKWGNLITEGPNHQKLTVISFIRPHFHSYLNTNSENDLKFVIT